jgi:plasmid replication initiation protein
MSEVILENSNQSIKKMKAVKLVSQSTLAAKLFNTVPFDSGFHFFTAIRNYTGITATNLSEFEAKLQIIPEESVKFHFQRKDFEKWIKDTIKDVELGEKIDRIREAQSTEDLREEILRITQERISELTRFSLSQDSVATNFFEGRTITVCKHSRHDSTQNIQHRTPQPMIPNICHSQSVSVT